MNKFLLGIVILLAALVGYLFYLHFDHLKKIEHLNQVVGIKDSTTEKSLRIAYVDLDSIEAKYDYYQEKMKEFEKKKDNIDQSLNGTYQRIENERVNFLKKGNAITQVEAEAFQREYTQKMQNLEAQKRNMEEQMQRETMSARDEVKKKIDAFLEVYNKDKGFSYIIATSSSMDILFFKDTTFNITREVVNGLNDNYRKNKPAKP
jgi:outer membrane protein